MGINCSWGATWLPLSSTFIVTCRWSPSIKMLVSSVLLCLSSYHLSSVLDACTLDDVPPAADRSSSSHCSGSLDARSKTELPSPYFSSTSFHLPYRVSRRARTRNSALLHSFSSDAHFFAEFTLSPPLGLPPSVFRLPMVCTYEVRRRQPIMSHALFIDVGISVLAADHSLRFIHQSLTKTSPPRSSTVER